MQTQTLDIERARMFRYSISRFSSFGPKQLQEAQEKIKSRTMKSWRTFRRLTKRKRMGYSFYFSLF